MSHIRGSDTSEEFTTEFTPPGDDTHEKDLLEHGSCEEPAQCQHKEKISALRSRIEQEGINNFVQLERCDDAFLLLFLRARYFRVPASYQLLCNYKEFRVNNASIFQNLTAWQLHHVIEDGFPCVLPYCNQSGAKMMVIFAGGWDIETYGTENILKGFILSMERLIEDEVVQRNGIIIIADFSGWTATHTSQLTFSFIRQVCCMLQDHYPARFLAFHFVNEPWYVRAVLSLLKPFINERIWKRIHLHGNNMATLHKHCDKDVLPAEFGGNKPSVNREYWARVLLDYEKSNRGHVYGENPLKCSLNQDEYDWETEEIPHVIRT